MNQALPESLRDFGLDDEQLACLERFSTLLLERNAAFNLTSARDMAALTLHLRDSLEIARFVASPHVDVGSGGGFPGVPLAIATGFDVTLIEATGKKAAFLREAAHVLKVPLTVVQGRAEQAARASEWRGRFRSATARAVGSTSVVLELTIPFLEVGGVAVLQRGRFEDRERMAAADAALVLGARVEAELAVGAAGERRVLLVRKIASTAQRFPRRVGIPAKRPLCERPADD